MDVQGHDSIILQVVVLKVVMIWGAHLSKWIGRKTRGLRLACLTTPG